MDEIKDSFDLFDTDGSGVIEADEFKVAMRALGFETDRKEIEEMMAKADANNNGVIEYNEFYKLMAVKMGNRDPREELLKAFKMADDEDTGKLSFKNLKKVAMELGE